MAFYETLLNFFISLFFSHALKEARELNPLSDEYIDLINSQQTSWKAGRNFHPDTSMEYIKGLMGLIEDPRRYVDLFETKHHDEDLINSLPESFDPRDKWPNCPSLNEIRNQGGCGSCWAIAAVEAMTDRYCIFSNGTKQFRFSTEDLLTCCGECGECSLGGISERAWLYWQREGIVSGGHYKSSNGCRPYEISPCIPTPIQPCPDRPPTPVCDKSCIPSYGLDYSKDKRYGGEIRRFRTEDDIKAELFTNGPIEVGFVVYPDFLNYHKDIYRHAFVWHEKDLGSHAVKMLGWGVENGTKYWLVANSWGSHWGHNKGFFKILRGENHCGIEDGLAGVPIII